MGSFHSPGKIFTCGHAAVRDIFKGPVQVQEKADGSFFAFGLVPASEADPVYLTKDGVDYALKVRSKGAVMNVEAPEALFKKAVTTVVELASKDLLRLGWTYRGECISSPKYNSLHYDRTPKGYVILFDICTDEETYLPYEKVKEEADRLDLEVVPQLFSGMINEANDLRKFFDTTSILGGQKIEGVVVKPLTPAYGVDGKILYAKLVSEAFKEVHRKVWGESNPSTGDIIDKLADRFGTLPRFNKARIHLDEQGKLVHDVKDIGLLIKEVPKDILSECIDEVKEELFKFAWPHIERGIKRAIPQYYKDYLLTRSFEEDMNAGNTGSGGTDLVSDCKQSDELVQAI